MSRNTQHFNEHTTFYYGGDHAIGNFFDVVDSRFEGHDLDETGEGFLLEWSNMFGITTNLIGATMEDLLEPGKAELIKKVDAFIAKLPQSHSA